MRVTLVGSDVEENLGLAMVGAALIRKGHHVQVLPYNELDELPGVVERISRQKPGLVGLGMQFQHRSADFVRLAGALRGAGYAGHVTAGGQYATLAGDEVLAHHPAFDSIVLHEGEHSTAELAAALDGGTPLTEVAGLLVRTSEGVCRTGPRPLCADLDSLPFALRYRAPNLHLGIPFFPVWGSRGCWGACAFCAITTYYRDAQRHGGGRKLRLRSPASIADEIAILWRAAGGPCIVCFHDDTFLLPRPADTLERVRSIRRELDARGVGRVGLVGKCRPETVTDELCRELRQLGVFRLYVGIENASQHGQDDLNRRTKTPQLRRALRAMHRSGIFGCYNLLVFEPDVTLDDVRENIAFIREHAAQPMNFCRAEPYHKTPLYERAKARGTLGGSYLGWDYRIENDRAELLYRITAAAFDSRNFMPAGVANRCMGLGYIAQVLRTFYDVSSPQAQRLLERAAELMRQITLDTADFLDEAVLLADTVDLQARDLIERKTARLGLRVLAHDRLWHQRLDELLDEMNAFVAGQARPPRAPRVWREALQGAALAGVVALSTQACGGSTTGDRDRNTATGGQVGTGSTAGVGGMVYDALPPWGGMGGWVADPLPTSGGSSTGGRGGATSGGTGGFVADMLPPTGGMGGWVNDPLPNTGGFIADMVPPSGGTGGWVDDALPGSGGLVPGGAGGEGGAGDGTAGASRGGAGGDAGGAGGADGGGVGLGGFIADMLPASGGTDGVADPLPGPQTLLAPTREAPDHWQNTAPRRARRSQDLPLFDPPEIRLHARRVPQGIAVTLCGGERAMTLRWEPEGELEGDQREVLWRPASDHAQLRVAARTAGGVSVTSLRANGIPG